MKAILRKDNCLAMIKEKIVDITNQKGRNWMIMLLQIFT